MLSKYFKIEFVNGTDNSDHFLINIIIDDTNYHINVEASSDWFDRTLLEKLNVILLAKNNDMELHYIEPYGVENSDQGFSITYINKNIASELLEFGYLSKSDWQIWNDQRITDFNDMFEERLNSIVNPYSRLGKGDFTPNFSQNGA